MTTLIVGLTTRAFAQSALRAGRSVRTVDHFGDLDQRISVPNISLRRDLGLPFGIDALVRVAREVPAHSVAYTAPFENHPTAIAELAEGRCLLGNPPEVVARVRDPAELGSVLREAGFRFPRLASSRDPTARSGRWLSKPLRSGGGHGIRFWNGGPLRPDSMLQEYVPGQPASALFLADGRSARLVAVTTQLIGVRVFGARAFRYCGNLLPLPCSPPLLGRLTRLVQILTEAFGLRGANGVDFVLTAEGPVVLEVNPRYTAAMELAEEALGVSVFDLHVRACLGHLPEVQPPGSGSPTWGKAILYARRTVRLPDTRSWIEQGVRDVPFPGEEVRRGQPICTLLARGSSPRDCLRRLVATARALALRIYGQPTP